MTISDSMKKLGRTADGRPWYQSCYVCGKQIDYTRTLPQERVRVGELVRHKKCKPETIK